MPIGTQSLQDACGQPRLGNAQDRAAAFRSARSGRQRSAHVLRSAGAPIGILPTSGQEPAIGDLSLGTKGIFMDFTTEWIRGCLKMRPETWESSRMEDSPSEMMVYPSIIRFFVS
jgi:hypothetical protein